MALGIRDPVHTRVRSFPCRTTAHPCGSAVATVLVAVTLGLSGCGHPFSGEVTPAAQVGTQASSPTVDGDPGAAQLTVAADADPDAWRPDQPIVVNAIAGTISEVTVTSAGGQDVAGALSDDRRHWQSSGTLLPGTTYDVRATMTGSADTDPVTSTISISTRDSAAQFRARISPRDGATVGVGMPILVTFTAPVEQDRRAAGAGRPDRHARPRTWRAPGTGSPTRRSSTGPRSTGRHAPRCR